MMGFGGALDYLNAGRRVTRDAWPAGQYLTLQDGYPNGIPINENTAAATGLPVGTVAVFPPYLLLHTPPAGPTVEHGKFVDVLPTFTRWAATDADLLAYDWSPVE